MSEREADILVRLLTRILSHQAADVDVYSYQNDTWQWVVCLAWKNGPIYLVSVRECIRHAKWYYDRGGPAAGWASVR